MSAFRRVSIDEYTASINGGVDVTKMYLTSMGYEVKKKRRVVNFGGRLAYTTDSGNTAYVLRGDVLYLKNGDVVEVV